MNINITKLRYEEYYSHSRTWPLLFQLKHAPRILDIGCGQGVLGKYLKDKIGAIVSGVEITRNNYTIASTILDSAILGDIETMDVSLLDEKFDYIIFSDSLEHLMDPSAVLLKIKSLISDGGAVLIAMPNVRNFRVSVPLLFKDRWEYTDEGLLDKTHLRFFTLSSTINLLHENGYDVESYYYDLPLSSKVGMLNLVTLGLFKKILTSHYFIRACVQKKS